MKRNNDIVESQFNMVKFLISLESDLYSILHIAVLYAVFCYIEVYCNGNQLHWILIVYVIFDKMS